jgi:hypothetical protein
MRKQANLKQNQIGGLNTIDTDHQHRNGTSSSFREYAKDIQVIADDVANSPTAWIYKGGKKLQDLCRPFIGGATAAKFTGKSDASVASWRKMAAKTILSGENMNSDDEIDNAFDGGRGAQLNDNHHSNPPYRSDSVKEGSLTITSKTLSNAGNPSMVPDEPRIIAPNVSKLSPRSVVEIRLQSTNECVAILCSVDVLKMRSSFFYDVLNEQEDGRTHTSGDQNDVWREPLVIPEISPFEAAAFLESLHEGRAVFKGDWVYSWVRLRYSTLLLYLRHCYANHFSDSFHECFASVTWQIQDLVLDYASQIDTHFGHLFSIIKCKNWRTNPSIWLGARVAVLRKGPTPSPTVVTG